MPIKELFGGEFFRSSTASHYASNINDVAVDSETREFYGITLSTGDLSDFEYSDLIGLLLLLSVLIFRNKISLIGQINPTAFWVAVLAVAYKLKEVTFIPILSTMIYTRLSYPYFIAISHCIVSACVYRSEIEKRKKGSVHFLSSFGLSFFCYGFGGSIVSDFLMGLPVTALGHTRIVPCYVLGYFLCWYSPYDIVYTSYSDPKSFAHFFLEFGEAIDCVTTPLGRISRSALELQNQVTAPIMAGIFAGVGGAVIRYTERVILQGNGNAAKASLAALESGMWRTFGYTILWWWLVVFRCDEDMVDPKEYHCSSYGGSDALRVTIVASYTLWTLGCLLDLVHQHPFVWIGNNVVVKIWSVIIQVFRLGPQTILKMKVGQC